LVFTTIVASIAALRDLNNAAKLVASTFIWFGITALIAVSIGLTLGIVLQPGAHAGVSAAAAVRPDTAGSWLDFLRGLVPANILGLEASTALKDGGASTKLSFNVLQLIVVAIEIGVAAVRTGEAGAPFLAFNASALAIFRRILRWVVRLTPVGTGALLGSAIVRYGWQSLSALGTFAIAVYVGLALVLFVVYPLLLLANGMSPRRFFAAAWPAIQLGFVSRSSIATLPVTEQVVEQGLGVPRSYAAFAVPFAATTKMDGCAAIYPAIAALFVAQYYGIPLHGTDYLLIVAVSVLGSAATAGLTGALVMLTLTLSTLGLPLEGAGLLLAIDPILDMGRTAVNVAGQALVPAIVAKRQRLTEALPAAEPLAA
ncbi:MAG: dicarboxylate/amino acid:cation symporter, partial [Sphingomonadaceae bacterium]